MKQLMLNYTATFVWKGEPPLITFDQFGQLNRIKQETKNSADAVNGNLKVTPGDTPTEVKAKNKASNMYLLACGITSAATSFFRPAMGPVGALFNVFFDCGIPYMYMRFGDHPVVQDFTSTMKGVVGPFIQGITDNLGGFAGTIIDTISGALGIKNNKLVDGIQKGIITDRAVEENVITAFVPSATVGSILHQTIGGETFSVTQLQGIGQRTTIAKNLSTEVSSQLSQEAFGGAAKGFEKTLQKELQKEINTELGKIATTKWGLTGRSGATVTTQEIHEAVTRAVARAGAKPGIAEAFYNSRKGLLAGASSMADETADSLIREIDLGSTSASGNTFDLTGHLDDAAVRANLSYRELQEIVQDDAVQSLKNKLGVGRIPKGLEKTIRGIDLEVTWNPVGNAGEKGAKTNVRITDAQIGTMRTRIEKAIKDDTIERLNNPSRFTGKYENALRKRFGTAGVSRIGSVTEDIISKGRPKFFSLRGIGLSLKNLAKEGMFGLAANAVGLKAYDLVTNGKKKE